MIVKLCVTILRLLGHCLKTLLFILYFYRAPEEDESSSESEGRKKTWFSIALINFTLPSRAHLLNTEKGFHSTQSKTCSEFSE